MKKMLSLFLLLISLHAANAETGYELWLRYYPIKNTALKNGYLSAFSFIVTEGKSATIDIAVKELQNGAYGLLQKKPVIHTSLTASGTVIIGTPQHSTFIQKNITKDQLKNAGNEGYIIATKIIDGKKCILIAGNTDVAVLYGAFHFLKLLQTEQPVNELNIVSAPKLKLRMLNHWDNLDRTVERGYAGFSIWNWHKLPVFIDKRYIDYARANASIGINGITLTNVNANATIITRPYLEKVKALADLLRPYGIKVFLTARFSAPIEIGKLKTADPLDADVKNWWREKIKEIYEYVPDFGGFLVKANSEGQPGPQDYKRTHADGANMLAEAIAPFKGIVIWRAFVYSNENPVDRHKQAYNDFVPLDGQFLPNVMVQVKNGAIDFMPREPFHPMFGAMPNTPLMMEFQVTQEYLGQSTSLVYLAPLFKEVLNSDTYCKGKGSTVAKVIDGSINNHQLNGMAGVSNIGNDINWCGHPFAQANWYALGRLSWDYNLSSEEIADEWLRMTFTNQESFLTIAMPMMLNSRETLVQYSNPIGLHHIMGTGHHYGPAPWVNNQRRPEWNPTYYHKADSIGIGFNRTASGSNALEQYHPSARKLWEDINTCEEKNLLWFHHVPWNFKMNSGRTLWNELCYHYYTGAAKVKTMQLDWQILARYVDSERHNDVSMLLQIQHNEAIWWRNSCLLYFQTFSGMPIPSVYEQPDKTLDYYKSLNFRYAPGN